jgi:hypothetical protein
MCAVEKFDGLSFRYDAGDILVAFRVVEWRLHGKIDGPPVDVR